MYYCTLDMKISIRPPDEIESVESGKNVKNKS